MNNLFNALAKKYQANIEVAKANIEVYSNNPVGIGDHPDLASAIDSEISKLCDNADKLKVLNDHFIQGTKIPF